MQNSSPSEKICQCYAKLYQSLFVTVRAISRIQQTDQYLEQIEGKFRFATTLHIVLFSSNFCHPNFCPTLQKRTIVSEEKAHISYHQKENPI